MICLPPQPSSWRLSAGAILILSLAACGGGGGSSTDSSAAQPSGKISLGGVVAKGLTGNANIKVLGISNGSVDESNVLATGQTNDAGIYSTTEFIAPAVYVVEVDAKACNDTTAGTGCSFHQDEATNARQYLPTGFKMRAVVTTTPSSKTVNVTPLSEMAVAAAERATGGVTVSNAQKGLTMVNSLAGVADLNSVPPTTLSNAAATSDQIRLAALLTAVSSMANNSSSLTTLGCTSATQGTPEATSCVVEKLASNANVEKYVGDDVAVTSALNAQLTAVVADKPEAKALVTDTATKLTDAAQTVPTPPSSSLSTAIDLVRGFFADLTSTVRTLLDSGTTPGQGAFLSEAHDFEAAVTGVDFQANATQGTIQTLHAAAKLWTDFEHGSQVVTLSGRHATGNSIVDYFWSNSALGFKCVLAKIDDSAIAPTDSASLIDHVNCDADLTYELYGTPTYSYPIETTQIRNGKHSYQVVKTGANAFSYSSSAVIEYATADLDYSTAQVSNWTSVSTACPQSAVDGSCMWSDVRKFSGTVTTSTDAQGRIQSIHIIGDLPDGFKSGTVLSHNAAGITGNLAKTHVDVTANLSDAIYVDDTVTSGATGGTLSFTGLTTAYGSDGSTFESSLAIGSGSTLTFGVDDLSHGLLNLTMLTPGAKLVGTLETTRTAGNGLDASFTGSLFNLSSSETSPFVSATVAISVDNSHFVGTDPYSSTNYQSGTAQFDGYITAPAHPKVRLVIGAGGRKSTSDYNWAFDTYGTLGGSYIIYNVDGSTKRDVSITVTSPLHDGVATTTFAEAATGISFVRTDGESQNVLVGGSLVGVISDDGTRLTFTNGDFISLDFGTVLY